MLSAMDGMPATWLGAIGMTAKASKGVSACTGHRLRMLALHGSYVMLNLFSPYASTEMCTVPCKSVDAETSEWVRPFTHERLAPDAGRTIQMEQDRGIVGIVGRVELGYVE